MARTRKEEEMRQASADLVSGKRERGGPKSNTQGSKKRVGSGAKRGRVVRA